jgi:hypothetical protein
VCPFARALPAIHTHTGSNRVRFFFFFFFFFLGGGGFFFCGGFFFSIGYFLGQGGGFVSSRVGFFSIGYMSMSSIRFECTTWGLNHGPSGASAAHPIRMALSHTL